MAALIALVLGGSGSLALIASSCRESCGQKTVA
jgi:hypothetical protein